MPFQNTLKHLVQPTAPHPAVPCSLLVTFSSSSVYPKNSSWKTKEKLETLGAADLATAVQALKEAGHSQYSVIPSRQGTAWSVQHGHSIRNRWLTSKHPFSIAQVEGVLALNRRISPFIQFQNHSNPRLISHPGLSYLRPGLRYYLIPIVARRSVRYHFRSTSTLNLGVLQPLNFPNRFNLRLHRRKRVVEGAVYCIICQSSRQVHQIGKSVTASILLVLAH